MHLIIVVLLFIAAVILWRGVWYLLDMLIGKDVTMNVVMAVVATIILVLYHEYAPILGF